MLELVIASGKGGTGKTSLVGSFAAIAGNAVLVDCDVDAANLHLIVEHIILEKHDFSSSSRASIIDDKCTLCGVCSDICRFDAIKLRTKSSPQSYWIDPYACEGCGLCKKLCPDDAIAFDSVISGEWFRSNSEYGPFLHARLGIAEANSGKLVSLLRQEARTLAEKGYYDLIIIDGPPGIGCPVIASVTGASYLLIVTEPSLSAIHDMKRLVDLAKHFDIKTGICINRYDINPRLSDEIGKFASTNGIRTHGRIPFDPLFAEAQLKGRSYMAVADLKKARVIKDIWQNVNRELDAIKNRLSKKKAV
jgi:MinD superfamily P-loop ATPase